MNETSGREPWEASSQGDRRGGDSTVEPLIDATLGEGDLVPLPDRPPTAALLAEMEVRWRAGQPAAVEYFFELYPDLADDREAVLDLVYREVMLREEHGERPRLEEYAARFPKYASALALQFQIDRALMGSATGESRTAAVGGASRPRDLQETELHSPSQQAAADHGLRTRIGRFQLQSLLGQGAFGLVYRAYDPQLRRELVLKVPRRRLSAQDDAQSFLREAQAAARLNHQGIVTVYEVGVTGDEVYIASEYVAGGSLRDALEAGPPAVDQAVRWIIDIGGAIAFAHAHNIIHRDLKPANVMLDRDRLPRVMDFGLARLLGESEWTETPGTIAGTPAYMAPEQAQGDTWRIGPASDQYALGVMLYEMLTGTLPFVGRGRDILASILVQPPTPPRELNRKVPRDVEAVCLKAMEKSPVHRYASVQAMVEDLQRWRNRRPVLARGHDPLRSAQLWLRRNAVATSAVAAALLIVVLASQFVLVARKLAARTASQESLRLSQSAERRMKDGDAAASALLLSSAIDAAKRAGNDELADDLHRQFSSQVGAVPPLIGSRTIMPSIARRPIYEVRFDEDATSIRVGYIRPRSSLVGDRFERRTYTIATGQAEAPAAPAEFSKPAPGEDMANVTTPPPHPHHPWRIALLQDGQGRTNGVIRLLEADLDRPLSARMHHAGSVVRAAFSPDGRKLHVAVAAGQFGLRYGLEVDPCRGIDVVTWDLSPLLHYAEAGPQPRQGAARASASAVRHPMMTAARFLRGGAEVVVGDQDGQVRFWRADSAVLLRKWDAARPVAAIEASDDGRWLATYHDTGLDGRARFLARLWDGESGRPIDLGQSLMDQSVDSRHKPYLGWVMDPCLLLASHDLFLGWIYGDSQGKLMAWKLSPPASRRYGPHFTKNGPPLAISPDAQSLALAYEGRQAGAHGRLGAGLFNPHSSRLAPRTMRHFSSRVRATAMAFSPAGDRLAVAGRIGSGTDALAIGRADEFTIETWSIPAGEPMGETIRLEGPVYLLAFDADGQTLFTADGHDKSPRIRRWDVESGKIVAEANGYLADVSSDGRLLLVCDGPDYLRPRLLRADDLPPVEGLRRFAQGRFNLAIGDDGRVRAITAKDRDELR